MPAVSVVIPTNRSREVLQPCLGALAEQDCDPRELEVLVTFNGGAEVPDWPAGAWPFDLVVQSIDEAHIGRAKNAALDRARGDWILLMNDDVAAEPGFVRAHLAAHESLSEPAMVLGASTWKCYADETVFDRMIQTTSMIFFYDQMKPNAWYSFRHAWNLNLSLHRRWLDGRRFDERLGPFFFEDIELAWRLEREQGLRVWYAPRAVGLHDHRYDLDGYLRREHALGRAAPRLWATNPDCFRDVYGTALDNAFVAYCREFVEREGRGQADRVARLKRVVERRCGDAFESPAALDQLVAVLYDAHLPLKRLAFRRGLLSAL